MSYNSATEKAIEEKQTDSGNIRLATVTAVTNNKPYVTFYGETTQSSKTYKHIGDYTPAVNDVVAMMPQAKTYIILGKVTDQASTNNYATKESVDNIINGTTTVGKATSATKATGDKKGNDITTTYSKTDHNHDSSYASKDHSHAIIKANDNYGVEVTSGGVMQRTSSSKSYAVKLGASSRPFDELYVNKIYSTYDHYNTKSTYLALSSSEYISGYKPLVEPNAKDTWSLGTSSKQFLNVYAKQFYQNGSAISTSDRNAKNTITDLDDMYKDFFKKLRPVTYKFNDGESGRLHAGFIAQEVEEAMHDSGISNMDFAGIIIQEDGTYGLRYDEFIAILISVVQEQGNRIEALERRLNNG